ncbi:MAG TPA: phosphotransferase [Thermoleophilaceae bacterium]|jgi:trehalose synthase-fused probable maltokinase
MTTADLRAALARGELPLLDEDALREFILPQRWFGSKAREVVHLGVLDVVPLRLEEPLLAAVLVEARFAPGTHEVYQLPVGVRAESDGWEEGVIASGDGVILYDALTDPEQAHALLHLMRLESRVESEHAVSEFHWVDAVRDPGQSPPVRPMGAEQSNTSVVFGDALALKLYRRVEAGINPELELTRFLTEREFESIPALAGWFGYTGRLMEATLGVLQEFLPSGRDGWELALDELGTDPEGFLDRVHSLAVVTGEMHSVLGSDASDPAFAPEEPSSESLGLLTATIDEEIERIFLELPDEESVEPIAGRGEEVREQLRMLTHVGTSGKVIRTHGDYHLGQTLLTGRGWIVLDFEGEPARTLPERRRKRFPLRDVAGMMRSFAYVASASEILRGVVPPEDWEARARETFLDGYVESVDASLMPAGRQGIEQLLSVFELEKAVYELRYELNNRPDWVRIPVAGILRLLEVPAT